MNDLISREYAIQLMYEAVFEKNGDFETNSASIIDFLKVLPAVDAEPVKHGKWVFEDGEPVNRTLEMCETAICNQCGETAPGYPFWECDLELTNFCPHCGAKMDKVEE